MVCFAELIEQGRSFMREVLRLVTIAEARREVVLDAWATTCHLIIFQGAYRKAQAGFAA